jgi:hypothetical protein
LGLRGHSLQRREERKEITSQELSGLVLSRYTGRTDIDVGREAEMDSQFPTDAVFTEVISEHMCMI